MKKQILFLLIFFLPLFAYALPDNLVKNPSFEDSNLLTHYYCMVWSGTGTISLSNEVVHSGSQSVKIVGKEATATVYQDVPVRQHYLYRVSAWVYTKDLTGLGLMGLEVKTNRGSFYSTEDFELKDCEWTRVGLEVDTGYANKLTIICPFKMYGAGTGTVYYDDLSVVAVKESTNRLIKTTKSIPVTKRYLQLPVKTGAKKYWLTLNRGEEHILQFDIELASKGEADFWTSIDLGKYRGETVDLELETFAEDRESVNALLDIIEMGDVAIKDSQSLYKEALRPQFHFTSKRGWLNDPNGLVYYDGEYHLFYQHNPFGVSWGNMHWGHAVSKDLVHWEELGDALLPDELGVMFSGSGVVDHHNVSGLQKGDEPPILLFYTAAAGAGGHPISNENRFTQCLAYSNDGGKTFNKYKGNPLVEWIKDANRDPHVVWYEPGRHWVMALHLGLLPNPRVGLSRNAEFSFFSSQDLIDWELESTIKIPEDAECPQLVEMPVNGNDDDTKWILYGASGNYRVGSFNGKAFMPETEVQPLRHGNCFYASQVWNNAPDGKIIQIAWGNKGITGMPFNMQMMLPTEMSLHRDKDNHYEVRFQPAGAVETLRRKEYELGAMKLKPGEDPLAGIECDLIELNIEFELNERVDKLVLDLRGHELVIDADNGEIHGSGGSASTQHLGNKLSLRVFVDRTTMEVFVNEGRIYMPMFIELDTNNKSLSCSVFGGDIEIRKLSVWELGSSWEN